MNIFDKLIKESHLIKPEWNKKYTTLAAYAFLVFVAATLFVFKIIHFSAALSFIGWILGILRPIFYGMIFAYLLNPLMKLFENYIFAFVVNPKKNDELAIDMAKEPAEKKPTMLLLRPFKRKKMSEKELRRALSLFSAVAMVILTIYTGALLFIPQIVQGYQQLVEQFPLYIEEAVENFEEWIASSPILYEQFDRLMASFGMDSDGDLLDEALRQLFAFTTELSPYILRIVENIVMEIIAIVIGLVLSIYFLFHKERVCAQVKKFLTAIFSKRFTAEFQRIGSIADANFGGFIRGKVVESIFVGIMAYFAFWIAGVPHFAVIALLIGITNVIPFFGPLIGAIPSGVLVLIANPSRFWIFLILVLIIQQISASYISPRLLGKRLGIGSMWIIIAVVVMNGLMGFTGMILGVPIFAIFYVLVKERTESLLRKRNLPTETAAYYASPPEILPAEEISFDGTQLPLLEYE